MTHPSGLARPVWKAILLLSLGVTLVAAGLVTSVVSARNRKWAALDARVRELHAQSTETTFPRLLFHGTALPGNAWDDYLQSSVQHSSSKASTYAFLNREAGADRAGIQALVSAADPAISALTTGTRREEAHYPLLRYEGDGVIRDSKTGFVYPNLVPICGAKARLLLEDGKTQEAIDLLLEVCLFARDEANSPLWALGLAGESSFLVAFRELRDMLQSREIPEAALKELDRRLALLEMHLPGYAWQLQVRLMDLGMLLIREDLAEEVRVTIGGKQRIRRSWRTCFSSRLQAAETFFSADDLVRRAVRNEARPWVEAGPGSKALFQEADQFKDPILPAVLNNMNGLQIAHNLKASIRLLRIAAHYRATGEILELEDPYGGNLPAVLLEGTLLAWSKGPMVATGQPKPGVRAYWDTTTIEVPRR